MDSIAAFLMTPLSKQLSTTNKRLLKSRIRRSASPYRPLQTARCSLEADPKSASSIGRELLGRNATWNQYKFEEWISMRAGCDSAAPVYWYAIGDVFSAPRGARELIIEGVDVAKTIRLSETKVLQLSRKIFVFRDIETGEVVTEHAGKTIAPLKYDYQAITYSLQGGCLIAETTMGRGDSIVTLRGDRFYWRDIGEGFAVCSPLFTERGWIENYDFYGGVPGRYRVSWHGVGPSGLVETGQVVMEMSGLRLDKFEDIPEALRSYINESAPLWRLPPKDMQEVRRLQTEL